ncbi:ATP-binding cassette domain-containing protein [Methanosphaerula palustris]|uniref:ABC transporter related n=1 Tax=Methanosphaerula palustris (strain ATCC BAA-1556 / DSM 19958 / E1-9c) TaxID=521011 RepID=B8GG20_METPE|nr:ABC transporter ATP-binding protein [Methanosphaerula palustris]ACL16094.1 ABC transporter related [Methanosphaerula palustris E1-9c]
MIEVRNLRTYYSSGILRRTEVRAVDGVSLEIEKGTTLGLVGESGCGKTTLGRSLLRLIEPTDGQVFIDGVEITGLSRSELRRFRPRMQMIFQDAYASLNPRIRMYDSIAEPLRLMKRGDRAGIDRRVRELIARVGLNEDLLNRRPYELSGGQNQRVVLARILSLEPDFIVADEPTSSLDVSVQAQILTLFRALARDCDTTCLFISHDIGVIRAMSDQVAIMVKGRIVEIGPTSDVLDHPCHWYTRRLVAASTRDADVPPSLPESPSGGMPEMVEVHPGHWVEVRA